MRVGRETLAGLDLATEVVELVRAQASLEERARIHARRGVALVEDLVAGPASLPRKNQLKPTSYRLAELAYVERWPPIPGELLLARSTIATAFQRTRRRIRRSIASSPGKVRLLLRADRVDVPGLRQRRQADVALAGTLEELVHDETGAVGAFLVDELVE